MSDEREQSPIDYKSQLADFLRATREKLRLSTDEVAHAMGVKEPTVRTWERGRSLPALPTIRALFDLYKVPANDRPELEQLYRDARVRQPKRPWGKVIPEPVRRLYRFESAASLIRSFHTTLVYGPAQTREMADLILTTPGRSAKEREQLVDARLARLDFLRRQRAPRLVLLILESVLYIDHGAPDVLKGQLLHLVRLAEENGVEVRIVPFKAAKRAYQKVATPFVLVTTPGQRTIVHMDNQHEGIFVDDPDRVADYETCFKSLEEAALPLDASLRLLSKVASEL
ncbi:hypothetical protein BBK82_03060 [Lentzea guizhouensis]|uniref:HTH cro/C1-type domain-containing protein n=1 Tax=Lentzea guizhouensis TaxID=1586287 RepID=A0A1B2HBU6_9PSEU|nr:helix-turn-helix transcriptional regulator [Lentzea guizhouensis]ANZ35198.1 hypothetical protein BBK82_03060 [Lentzea guizhouensis]